MSEDLSGIGLGDIGACAVAEALKRTDNLSLVRLYLGNNCIGDRGIEAIASALAVTPAPIRRVFAEGNDIGVGGARALAAVVVRHQTLKEVDLVGNRLSAEDKREVRCSNDRQQLLLDWDLPVPTYMSSIQSDINERMRCILNDWLSDVFFSFARRAQDSGMLNERKLFLAFSLIDRYLTRRAVARGRLQLVGVACAFAAVRHGEPGGDRDADALACARWLAGATDSTYTLEDVITMAAEVRATLGDEMDQPTVYSLLLRYLCRTGWKLTGLLLAEYMLHLTALSYPLLQHSPQAVTTAVVILTHGTLGEAAGAVADWQPRLLRCAHVTLEEVVPCIRIIKFLHSSAREGSPALRGHTTKLAAYRKYATPQMQAVADLPLHPAPKVEQMSQGYLQELLALPLMSSNAPAGGA